MSDMPHTMVVNILPYDMRHGTKGSFDCPIARAVKGALAQNGIEYRRVGVSYTDVAVWDKDYNMFLYELPKRAVTFIKQFERSKTHLTGFSFVIEE